MLSEASSSLNSATVTSSFKQLNLNKQLLTDARTSLINFFGPSIVSPPLLPGLWSLIEAYSDAPVHWQWISCSLQQNTTFQDYLWSLIEASKTTEVDVKKDKEIVTAAANAATILNAIRIAFNGRNLKAARIPGADLSSSILDRTDLQEADCQNVTFQGAWLAHANFTRTKMQGANFREWPYIQMEQAVSCLVYSTDGKYLALGSGHNLYLYETQTQSLKQAFRGHTNLVRSVHFSQDGRTLASGSADKTARLWEVSSGKMLQTFVGHTGEVRSVHFSQDGRTLASGGGDNTARLWEVSSGKMLQTFIGHTNFVLSVSLSQDGRTLASGSGDKTARLWEVSSGKTLQTFAGHTEAVISVHFSQDGRTLASGSWDKTARLWEVSSGKMLQTFRGHTGSVNSVHFSQDGRTLASGSADKTARLWEMSSGKMLQTFTEYTRQTFQAHTGEAISVSLSQDGRTLASGSDDGTVRLWEVSSGKTLQTFRGHTDWVSSVHFSQDGRTLASGSRDYTARVWEVSSGKTLQTFKGHASGVMSVSLSQDGRTLASGSLDYTVRLWEVSSGKTLQTFRGHTGAVYSVSLSQDGRTLASGSDDKTARLWEVSSGKTLQTFRGHTAKVTSVSFSQDGRMLVSGSHGNTARLWEVKTGKCLIVLEEFTSSVLSVAFLQKFDGLFLIAVSEDSSVRYFRIEDRMALNTENSVAVQLLWSSHPTTALYAANAHFEGALLSPRNAKLVTQRGALGKPREIIEMLSTATATADLAGTAAIASATAVSAIPASTPVAKAKDESEKTILFQHKPSALTSKQQLEQALQQCMTATDKKPPSPAIALRRAAATGKTDIVKILLECSQGLDINQQNDDTGQTALHVAVLKRSKNVIEVLLAAGASQNIEDYEHKKPVDYAKESGDAEIEALFKAKLAINFG